MFPDLASPVVPLMHHGSVPSSPIPFWVFDGSFVDPVTGAVLLIATLALGSVALIARYTGMHIAEAFRRLRHLEHAITTLREDVTFFMTVVRTAQSGRDGPPPENPGDQPAHPPGLQPLN